jgi:hypothetical protein
MKRDSVRSAVSASTLTIVVTVSIQSSIANSETNALFGRCQKTEGRRIWRWGDREMGRWGDQEIRDQKIRRLGNQETS